MNLKYKNIRQFAQAEIKDISDSEDKTIAGHKTEAMRQKYDTKIHSKKPAK